MVESGRSAAVASQLVGRALEGERAIAVDQTNHSVVVAETVVVKWLQPPVPSPHPGVDLLRYLAARGFAHMPGFVGVYEVDDMVLAVVTEFVPGALDGWDWYVDDVDAWLRGELEFDVLVESAREMGDITSQLHDALSGLQRSAVSVRAYHAQADSMLQQAMRLVDGDEGHRLRSLERSVRVALEPLRDERQIPAHRIHGDLHAGQFLRVGSGANASRQLLTDFDGNPVRPSEQRSDPQPAAYDVAGMLASPEVSTTEEYADELLTLRLKSGSAVHLVARGHMFNLAGPRPIGNSIEAMDLGFALQARCLEAVARGTVTGEFHVVETAVRNPRAVGHRDPLGIGAVTPHAVLGETKEGVEQRFEV